MPSDPEEIQDDSVDRQEPLRLSGRLEPSHLSLSLSGRLVRDLSPVVGVARCVMGHRWHHPAMRSSVAAQLVGNETPGLASLCRQQPVEEALSGEPISTRLDEDVDRVAVLVDSPPEIVPFTADGDEELVQVPGVAHATSSPGEVAGVHRAELATPLPDGLVGDDDPAFGEEIFDVSEAEAEAVVQPDCVADDLGWESVSAVARRIGFHRVSLPG